MRFCIGLLVLIQSSFALSSNLILCEAELPAVHDFTVLTVSIFEKSGRYRVLIGAGDYQESRPVLHVETTGIGFLEPIATCIREGVTADSCIETYFGQGTADRNQLILEAVEIYNKHNFGFDILQAAQARKYFATPINSPNPAGLTEYYDLRGYLMGRVFSPGNNLLVKCTSKEPKDALIMR